MLVCKYSKLESSVFVPHLDTLRAVTMAIRRCGLQVDFSDGFNPHMQLYFNQPLPIGVGSTCEYFCVFSNEQPEKFMMLINKSLPSGIRVLKCKQVDVNPNLAKIMYSALYEVEFFQSIDFSGIVEILKLPEYKIEFMAKGENQCKQVRGLIQDIFVSEGKLMLRLRCGNENLRADRLVNQFLNDNGLKSSFYVIKKEMFDESGKVLDQVI